MAASSLSEYTGTIDTSRFYDEWSGHRIDDLTRFHNITLAERPNEPIVYLAGDSSLDNKFWIHKTIQEISIEVPKIYYRTLNKPQPIADVAFWMNNRIGGSATCINAAVEASMLRDRDDKLLPQDEFIRDNIRSGDILIVSVGGNDVAMNPLPWTVFHMLRLVWLTSRKSLEDGTASSLSYFKHMFGAKIENYVSRLTAKTKPRGVIVCMIYFPLEARFGQESWSDFALKMLQYNSDPGKLQAAIRAIYRTTMEHIKVEGSNFKPCALYDVLDGQNPDDYTARVEPNHEGGRKIALRLVQHMDSILNG